MSRVRRSSFYLQSAWCERPQLFSDPIELVALRRIVGPVAFLLLFHAMVYGFSEGSNFQGLRLFPRSFQEGKGLGLRLLQSLFVGLAVFSSYVDDLGALIPPAFGVLLFASAVWFSSNRGLAIFSIVLLAVSLAYAIFVPAIVQ